MKKYQLFLKAFLCLFIIVSFLSCKKDSTPKPTCRIITATEGTSTYNFSYNSEGQLITIIDGTETSSFAYSGNTIVKTTTNSGTFTSKEIITLNSSGLATNIRTEQNTAGTIWDNEAYDFNGTEVIKATSTSSSGGTPTIATLTWSGGNLISYTSGSNVQTLDYSLDKPAQAGDYLDFIQLIQGYRIYKSKNQIKSFLSGSDITTFSYNSDSDGKIISLTATSSSTPETVTYQYQCN